MKAITANELYSGVVLFQSLDRDWTADVAQAALYADEQSLEPALKAAQKDEAEGRVIGAYEIDMVQIGSAYLPMKLRERIRAEGPSVAYGKEMRLEGFYAA